MRKLLLGVSVFLLTHLLAFTSYPTPAGAQGRAWCSLSSGVCRQLDNCEPGYAAPELNCGSRSDLLCNSIRRDCLRTVSPRCSVTDINAGETPVFTASGFIPSHNYAIQVACTAANCDFNQTYCTASDANGNINVELLFTGHPFDTNGTYRAIVGEVLTPFPCSRKTDAPTDGYCAPTFNVSGGTRDFSGDCRAQWVGAVCTIVEDNCNTSAGYLARTTERGRAAACGCECFKPSVSTPLTPICAGEPGINTALGCIPTEPTDFVAWFLGWAISLAGGIAFLLILFGGFRVITSAGDPEQLQAGRELITAAIAGLLVIIFSLFLLRLIGITIFHLPQLK